MSYGAVDVVGRSRTCDAPRFRRALYRLSFDHVDGQGWTRTSSLLFVRQALFAIELLACACPQAADRLAATAGRETPKAAAFAAGRPSEVPREGLEPSRAWPTALSTPRVYRSATSM